MKTRHLSSYFCFSYKSITSSRLVCLKNISLAVSFHAKAESAMSRISDIVNKTMQISGEMNNFRSLQLSKGFQRKKNVSFLQFTSGNLWESKRTHSMNFHELFNTYRAEFIEMHVYRIRTFLVRSLNNEAKYRQLAFIEIILI